MTNPVMITVYIMYVDVIVILHGLIIMYSTKYACIGVRYSTFSTNDHVQFVACDVVSRIVYGQVTRQIMICNAGTILNIYMIT